MRFLFVPATRNHPKKSTDKSKSAKKIMFFVSPPHLTTPRARAPSLCLVSEEQTWRRRWSSGLAYTRV